MLNPGCQPKLTQENMLSCIPFREVAHGLACDAASAGSALWRERQRTGTVHTKAEGAAAGSLGLTGEIIVGLFIQEDCPLCQKGGCEGKPDVALPTSGL